MERLRQSVAIFWDFENCALHSSAGGWEVDNIRRIAQEYGAIKIFKAYLEISSQSSPKTLNLRSELQSCGVSLTDCPHNGRKDVADKMMLVDMLTFALDTEAPATIVLLSGDRDFVYALSVLRLRSYHTVVIAPKQAHPKFNFRASEVLDWDALVLRRQDAAHHRSASDTGVRPNIDPSQCAVSTPLSTTIRSPFLDTSRRSSFKEDRIPASPRRPHARVNSEQTPRSPRAPRIPLPTTNETQSPSIESNHGALDPSVSESAIDDSEELLFSSDRNDPPTKNSSESSPFVDSATNLNADGLCGNSQSCRHPPYTACPEHAVSDDILPNVNQADAIGEPTAPAPKPAHAASAESVQPAPSQPVPSSSQVLTLFVPSPWPTTTSTFLKQSPTVDRLDQSQPTSLPAKPVPQGVPGTGATVPGSSEPSQPVGGAGLKTGGAQLAAERSEAVSASELDDARPFLFLIYVLDQARLAGTIQVSWPQLGMLLMQHNRKLYEEAGVHRLKEYVQLAQERGIVGIGGSGHGVWASLSSKWHGQGRPA